MSAIATKLLKDALQLSEAERADIASCLYASLDDETSAKLDAEWDAAIQRRISAIESGQANLVPWEEARKRIFANG
jgi:putative addiction module component (TIGR02574 family)